MKKGREEEGVTDRGEMAKYVEDPACFYLQKIKKK